MWSRIGLTIVPPASLIVLAITAISQAGTLSVLASSGHQPSKYISEIGVASGTPSDAASALGVTTDISGSRDDDPDSRRTIWLSPILIASARDDGGIGSFNAFLNDFLSALAEGRTVGYIGHIRFPLPVARFETSYVDPVTGEAKRSDRQERRTASRADFTPFLIHDPDAWTQSVHHLGDAFSGPNTQAIYRGNRMLTFARVDNSWVLSETRVCIQCGIPAVLLCARPDRLTEFPGRGPDGNEDFYAFFEVFYCAAHSYGDSDRIPHLSEARTNPDDAALSRIQFPLRGHHAKEGPGEPEEFVVTGDGYSSLGDLFQVDGHQKPPTIVVDGDEARTEVLGAGFSRIIEYSRINGLWYVTGLGS